MSLTVLEPLGSQFQDQRFSRGERSDRMLTVTPFQVNLEMHIRQFYVNENGEEKAGRVGIILSIDEFNPMLKIVAKIQDSIARYDMRDTGICAQGPFAVSQCCPDLNTVFLPSPSSQKSMSLNQDKKVLEMSKISFPFTDSTIGAVDRPSPPPPALFPAT